MPEEVDDGSSFDDSPKGKEDEPEAAPPLVYYTIIALDKNATPEVWCQNGHPIEWQNGPHERIAVCRKFDLEKSTADPFCLLCGADPRVGKEVAHAES